MLNRLTCDDFGNVTFSPASADGASPPDSPDGPTTASSGPVPRRASRSRSPAKAKPRLTIGTCGPTFFDSPVPDGPLSSWESRLRRRLARTGSTECSLTWKASATPAGRPLSRLVPSMRPTDGTGCGLWPTPTTRDWKDSPGMSFEPRKDGASRLDLVPRQVYWMARHGAMPAEPLRHPADASLPSALWPTPTASADKSIRTPEGARTEVDRGKSPDLAAHVMALWPTPTSLAPARNGNNQAGNSAGLVSIRAHALAMWPTPTAVDGNRGLTTRPQDTGKPLPQKVGEVLGIPPAGSSATTEKPGALNPAFVCWLMGFLPVWESCAPTAMPSSRRSRPK